MKNMKEVFGFSRKVCTKCGSGLMVALSGSCKTCQHNGFYVDDDIIHNLDMVPSYNSIYYDEDLRKIVSKKLGKEVERDTVEEDGLCWLGQAYGEGCTKFYCTECGEMVFEAFEGGC